MKAIRLLLVVSMLVLGSSLLAKPNVIFILTDDLGYGDVGYAFQNSRKVGEARIYTPNIDKLAEEGVILSSHYCAAPVCAPSRASILTGRLQGRCSVKNNEFDSPIREPNTLGTVMREAGYHTLAVGKWGVGGGGQSGKPLIAHPLDKGFDRYYGFLDHLAGHTYYHYKGNLYGAYMGITEDRTDATDTAIGRYSTDLFTAKAKQYISETVKAHPGEPFFMYLAMNTIHGSGRSDDTLKCKETLHVPGGEYPKNGVTWPIPAEPLEQRNTWIDPKYRSLPKYAARYATAITRLDNAIGDLMNHLKTLGVDKNTIVIFTSDNGPADEYGADVRFFGSNGPFDGLKRDVYEGGMRVPTFVWQAGGFKIHKDDSPSISTDWMATLADIAGVKSPESCDGVSLLPRWKGLKGKKSEVRTQYYGDPSGQPDFVEFSLRKEGHVRGNQMMRRDGDQVYLRAGKDMKLRLYDVVKDPHQDHDLLNPTRFPWERDYDDKVKAEWVTPDNVIGEEPDEWREEYTAMFEPVVKDCATATEAVQKINSVIWKKTGVKYSKARDKARQSPHHSMRTGLASCTGMAIIQVCAYRSVGIPARLVGCNWTTLPGNHSWVEFMDKGEWHFFGDGDPSPIDDSWVAPFAAEADASRPDRRIYASRATPNEDKLRFWTTWDWPQGPSTVWADDVTERYRKYKKSGTSKKDVPKNTNYSL